MYLITVELSKKVRHKPDSVPLIYNGSYHLSNATYPPGSGRATLNYRYIWSCSLPVRTPPVSPTTVVSSYLTFSPLPMRAVVFCYALHKLSSVCAFHREVLCAVRTFLSRKSDRKSHLQYKDRNIFQKCSLRNSIVNQLIFYSYLVSKSLFLYLRR